MTQTEASALASNPDRAPLGKSACCYCEERMIAQLVIRILAVLQLPPYAQNVMLAT